MIWSLFGAIVGWIQGALGQFRSTGGYLEHTSNGSTWIPASPQIVKASTNIKYSWATVRTAGSNEVVKILRLTPMFSGQIRFDAEMAVSAGTGHFRAVVSGSSGYPAVMLYEESALGTVVLTTANLLPSQITIASSAVTSYTPINGYLNVQAGQSIVCVLHNITAGATTNIRNVTVSYDIISSSYQQTV